MSDVVAVIGVGQDRCRLCPSLALDGCKVQGSSSYEWGIVVSDVVRERKNEVRNVREFLYVDHQRIRSYYSQINRGVIESVISRGESNVAGEVGAKLFGFGPSASYERGTQREESRSLQDLNYIIFEELFEQEGLIEDITDKANNIEMWQDGSLHSSIEEGDIVKYTGNIQVLDPEFTRSRLTQFGRLVTAFAGTQVGNQESENSVPPVRQGGSTRPGRRARSAEEMREALIVQKVTEFSGGVSLGQLTSLGDLADAFANSSIIARAMPFGSERPEYHFAGTLLSRSEYIQPEREALFSRYGTRLNNWTMVMQMARIPPPDKPKLPDFSKPTVSDDVFSRGALENMIGSLLAYMEGVGMAEGAQYPAMSVTVLAIYREFAPLPTA